MYPADSINFKLPKVKSPKHTRNWTVLMRLVSQQFEAGFKSLQMHIPYVPKLIPNL